jgi:RHS repeat-associated protein
MCTRTRSDNVIVWRWDSDPYGTSAPNEDPDGDSTAFAYDLRFPGQYADAESGINYNYFRDYDPTIGRYIESDPIGLKAGVNTYAYGFDNPLRSIDPLGLVPGAGPGYFRIVNCPRDFRRRCENQCASRGGVKSCKVTKGAIGMPPKIYIVPTSMSCECNCEPEPEPEASPETTPMDTTVPAALLLLLLILLSPVGA